MSPADSTVQGTPIALVGIGCRFPGGVSSPADLWSLLERGGNAITEIPADRIDLTHYYDERPATPGRIMTRWGGFLPDIEQFDAGFFGISPREAERMDPNQRLVLETAWEGLEDAGIDVAALDGSATGVFVGQWLSDFEGRLFADPEGVDFYMTTGSGRYCTSGRLSYLLGLRGPSLTVDTACSSSLVAVHLAVRSLRNGECTLALAGGVNVILQPHISVAYSQSRMMAPDGHCKFGDARGDGYVRSEGAGIVVLKPLDRALADGDRIYAVIRGSAVNNDGHSSGSMGTPSRLGQMELLQSAYRDANVSPGRVGLVEAHGTGTRAGDPVELGVLGAILSQDREPQDCAYVGSVKTNIGHTEGAAGVAGLIKAALALYHELIPPSLHFVEPNPAVGWNEIPLRIPTSPVRWPRGEVPRLAAVSAFGIAGTNAHVVLQEAATNRSCTSDTVPPLLLLSAASPEALTARAGAINEWISHHKSASNFSLGDLFYTAAVRRTHHEHRLAVVAEDADELQRKLSGFLAGQSESGCVSGRAAAAAGTKVAFIFPGQGSQWLGMGRDLLRSAPVFRDALERCDRAIEAETGWSLLREMHTDEASSRLGDIDVVQPMLFSLEVALAALWRSYGIEPTALVGHSMGEVAAACVAGALSLEEAVRVICRRSRLLREARGKGAMALVELSLDEASAALAKFDARLSVAVSNSSRSTVVAGDPQALNDFLAELERRDVFHRRINVDVASHSPQMDPLLAPLQEALGILVPRDSDVPIHSTVDSRIVQGHEFGAEYWVRNLRQPVRFSAVVRRLLMDGYTTFIEMSPHPVLLPSIQQEAQSAGCDVMAVGSLVRHASGLTAFHESLARLHVSGHAVRWGALFPSGGRIASLPVYPWQRERHWYEPPARTKRCDSMQGLLGPMVASSVEADTRLWDVEMGLDVFPFLADHRVRGSVIVPAVMFIELACEAMSRAFGSEEMILHDLMIEEALLLEAGARRVVQVALTAGPPGLWTLRISSHGSTSGEAAWTVHARGFVRVTQELRTVSEQSIPTASAGKIPASAHYAAMQARGLDYGPAFQGLVETVAANGALWGRVALPAGLLTTGFIVHPSLLDSALQLAVASISNNAASDTYVPVSFDKIRCKGSDAVVGGWARALPHPSVGTGADLATADVTLFGDDGKVIVEVLGLRLKRLESARRDAATGFFAMEWERQDQGETQPIAATATTGEWLLVADRRGIARALVEPLRALGYMASLIEAEQLKGGMPSSTTAGVVFLAEADAGSTQEGSRDPVISCVQSCDRALSLIRILVSGATERAPQLVVVTTGAQAVIDGDSPVLEQAPLWGMIRTLANEHPELRSRLIDLSAAPSGEEVAALARELVTRSEDQVALRDAARLLPRLRPMPATGAAKGAVRTSARAGRAYRAVASTPGILDGLVGRPLTRRPPARGEVEIEIEATGLNFMNVMSALGTCPGYPDGVGPLGLECSGQISAVGEGVEGLDVGVPVLAIAIESLASHVIADARLVRPRPQGLTAAQAASVPIAFATAHYALAHLGRLRCGERVLIHAAAGGVGLAAVQVARHLGAEVFATAGSPEKRALLAAMGIEHIMDSRSLAFRDELLAHTDGEGVDAVLNSLAGDFVPASLAVLKPYGRFLEIGKKDIYRNAQLGLLPFSRNLSYFAIDLDRMIRERPDRVGELLDEILARLVTGDYQPLPVATTPVSRMAEAFRDMAQGRHTGKIVLTHHDAALQLDDGADATAIAVSGACVITGGLGGLGLAVAEWLVRRGASCLALVGRSAANDAQRAAVERLRSGGARVSVLQADVSSGTQVRELLAEVERQLGPVTCVVHAAGLLDDALMQQQSAERFARVMAPKIGGAWNLHTALRERSGATLILFSSVASLLGLAGQANYAAANAWLDALAHYRRARGEPTLSINWAPWSNIGMAAARVDRGARLEDRGLASLSPAVGLAALERVFEMRLPQVAVMNFDAQAYAATYPAAARCVLLAELAATAPATEVQSDGATGLKDRLLSLEPGRRRLEAMHGFLKEQVGKVLRQSASRLDADKPFHTLGLDSLMGLELRNRLEAETGLTLSATMVWNYPTISALAQELATRLGMSLDADRPAGGALAPGAAADGDLEAMLAEIELLSSDEARQLLAQDE